MKVNLRIIFHNYTEYSCFTAVPLLDSRAEPKYNGNILNKNQSLLVKIMKIQMKRACVLFLISVLFFAAIPVRAAQTGTYIVAPYSTPMRETPEENGNIVCDVFKGTILNVTDIRNGYGYIYRNSLACGGWVDMNDVEMIDGEKYSAETITRLMIMPPDKLTYIAGEEAFDDKGMSVWAVFEDGVRKQIEGYALYLPSLNTVGNKTVYISYTPENSTKTFSVSFQITVLQVPVNTLSFEGSMQTEYVKGQKVSLDGLLMRASYLDSRPDALFTKDEILKEGSGFTLTDCCGELSGAPLTVGQHSITVTYLYPYCTAVIPITVVPSTPKRLEILTLPHDTTFFSDTKKPNLAGMLVAVYYDNGEIEYLNHLECTYSFDEENAVYGRNEITIHCRGISTVLGMTMVDPALVGIEVVEVGKSVYALQESFASETLVVNGLYESGQARPVYGWTFSGYDKTKTGEQTVQISLDGFTDSCTVYVTPGGYLPGDVNLDQKITAADARLILRCSVALENLTGASLLAADRTNDGKIEAADARSTLRAAVKLEPLLPVA